MKRIALAALGALFLLPACASSRGAEVARYTVTPQVAVVVKAPKKRTAQANYQAAPEDAPVTGAAGSR